MGVRLRLLSYAARELLVFSRMASPSSGLVGVQWIVHCRLPSGSHPNCHVRRHYDHLYAVQLPWISLGCECVCWWGIRDLQTRPPPILLTLSSHRRLRGLQSELVDYELLSSGINTTNTTNTTTIMAFLLPAGFESISVRVCVGG